ncbi:MAG: ribonuclease III [Pirellulaceae bacterium]|nr:ribonuclease III [Pirellulaceae bacterium]
MTPTNDHPPSIEEKLNQCEEKIGYRFNNRSLLQSALTHSSGADSRADSNERLEFLGDSILGFIVCEKLYRDFPDYQEGDLTKLKSVVVSRSTCTRISQKIGLTNLLVLGKAFSVKKDLPDSLLANVFESLIAAVFLDGGYDATQTFVLRYIEPEIQRAFDSGTKENFKSLLQQFTQKEFGMPPNYIVLTESGPDHSKSFQVAAVVDDQVHQSAWGRNKKEAEQKAAQNALRHFQQID